MVATRLRARRGRLPIGFLVTVALVGLLVYGGIAPAHGYLRYYRMKGAMRTEVRGASSTTDEEIRHRLRTRAAELGLPADAGLVTIRRRARPPEITVSTRWTDTVTVLFYAFPITYRPEARAPL